MTKSEQRNWNEKGPPTWMATWLILISAILSYVAAGLGIGRFYELTIQATEFWPTVYMIGLGGSYFIRKQGLKEKMKDQGTEPNA